MKKLLTVLLVLQIISVALIFLVTLAVSIFSALVSLIAGILQIVLTYSVIYCLDNIDDLNSTVRLVHNKLFTLNNELNPIKIAYQSPPVNVGEKSENSWQCVKCGTVNKEGTSHCENCGTEYSPSVNPTFTPNPKKISRFLKEKKNK